jgi:hypothetical protein
MPRVRSAVLSFALAALVLGGAVTVGPWLLWGDRADYSHVTSISGTSEYQSPVLLEKAWALPVARLYRPGVEFQQNASFCGPASLVNVLHSRGEAGGQETILAGTGIWTVAGMLPGGLTLDELAVLAKQRLGSKVTVLRDLDLPSFRRHMLQANDPSRRYVVNFSRGPLFGSGSGHHSPNCGLFAGRRPRPRARREPQLRPMAGEVEATARSHEHGRSDDRRQARPATRRTGPCQVRMLAFEKGQLICTTP